MLPKELEQAEESAIGERLQRMRSRMSLSQASGAPGFPRTFTNATNATHTSDPESDRFPRGRQGSVGGPGMSPRLNPVRRDTSPTAVMHRGRRDSSPSVVRIDAAPPPRRHQRSMSSGASSVDSPVTNPTALASALQRLAASGINESTPPVASKLSNLPGLSPLVENDMSRRGTVAEPEQMEMSRPARRSTQSDITKPDPKSDAEPQAR